MDIEVIRTAIIDFIRAHEAYAPFVIGLMTFAESLAFVSLFLPTMTILMGIGFVLAAADIPFWQLWLGGATGAFLSNWISYEIGRRYKKEIYRIWPVSKNPQLAMRGESFFQRFGPWAVFLGRFFGPIRAVIALISGIFVMPRILFQAASLASAFVWAFVILAPGASLAEYLQW